MTTGLIIFLFALGLLIQFGLIYGAIMLATEKERKLVKIQTAILANMAIKQGVSEQDIKTLFVAEKLKILL